MDNSAFEFQAPQFKDFNSGLDDSDDADKFFDVEQETPRKEENKENKGTNISENKEISYSVGEEQKNTYSDRSNVIYSSTVTQTTSNNNQKESNLKKRTIKRASRRLSGIKEDEKLSPENLNKTKIEDNLSEVLSNINLKPRKRSHFEGIEIKIDSKKGHGMVTRNDEKIKTPKIELRTRTVVKSCDQNKSLKRKSIFERENRAPEKYMAMAEHILHFQRDTPPRFHSHRRQSTGVSGSLLKKRQSYKPRTTVALTPKLMTSSRSRPVDVPSTRQREEMELQEIKKNQIKANPLNGKIFLPPKLPPKHEKQNTAPVPFNITQVVKKEMKNEEEPFKFTANPVPKTILERPVGIAPKKEIPITVPESPAITKPAWAYKRVKVAAISNEFQESSEDLTSFGVPMPEQPRRTEVKPFSFELRDKLMIEKREKKIKEIIEAEKKMREFKANPAPSFVASKDATIKSNFNCSKVSLKSVNESEEIPRNFKARSPRVLRKEPFKPVTEHAHSEPMNIQLHTDRRALERQEFEQKKAEKEEEMAGLKELMEIRKKEQQEAEIAKLRKETVHKAQPMPKFKPVPINEKVTSSLPLTNPQSPKFTKRTRTTTLCCSSLIQK